MRIHISESPRATSAQGVAIILNRELVDVQNVEVKQIIPGRAMILKLHWHQERTLTVLNVYAPNITAENTQFWEKLLGKYNRGSYRKPDVVMGDFNITEEAIDRLPAREDSPTAVQALAKLMRAL